MADWLRPVFSRQKSSLNIVSTPTTTSLQTPSEDDRHNETPTANKPRPASRLATFMGIGTSTPVPTIVEPPPELPKPKLYAKVRPRYDCDGMVEHLKSVMMTHDTFNPLPRDYNVYIMYVLEAYQELREKLERKMMIIDDLRMIHASELEEFENMASHWEQKEKAYKLEIKRLEVMLSKTDGGVENVALARSQSMVHGTGRAADSIGNGLKTIRGRNVVRDEQHYWEAKRQKEDFIRAAVARYEGICSGSSITFCYLVDIEA